MAEVSCGRIAENGRLLKERAGVKLIAVVKDDGYGHGGEAVAHALHGVADMFAVATVKEGAALRIAGIGEDILLLNPVTDGEEALRAACYGLIFTLSSFASLTRTAEAKERFFTDVRAHLAFNTGMNRIGFRVEDAARACMKAKECGISVEGCYSHFYRAEHLSTRESQYALFMRAAEEVKKHFPQAMCHLSATGGVLSGKRYNFDAVRSGIALYGYSPEGFEGKIGVKPAAKLYATVTHRTRQVGEGAGYQATTQRYAALHTLRIGYGDGLFRVGGAGIGNACMDACVLPGDAPFGRRVRILRDLEGYAKLHGTSIYEVLVSVLGRAEKRYV